MFNWTILNILMQACEFNLLHKKFTNYSLKNINGNKNGKI